MTKVVLFPSDLWSQTEQCECDWRLPARQEAELVYEVAAWWCLIVGEEERRERSTKVARKLKLFWTCAWWNWIEMKFSFSIFTVLIIAMATSSVRTPKKPVRAVVPASPSTRKCVICDLDIISLPGYYTVSYTNKGKLPTIEHRLRQIIGSEPNVNDPLHSRYMCKKCFKHLNDAEKAQGTLAQFKRRYMETKNKYVRVVRSKRMTSSPSASNVKRSAAGCSPKANKSSCADATKRRIGIPSSRRRLSDQLLKEQVGQHLTKQYFCELSFIFEMLSSCTIRF